MVLILLTRKSHLTLNTLEAQWSESILLFVSSIFQRKCLAVPETEFTSETTIQEGLGEKKEFSMEENYYSLPQKLLQESVLETTTGEWLGNYILVVGASETTISSAWKPSTRGCLEKYY